MMVLVIPLTTALIYLHFYSFYRGGVEVQYTPLVTPADTFLFPCFSPIIVLTPF